MRQEPGSYRDPRGQIYHQDGRLFRTVTEAGYQDFMDVAETGLLQSLINSNRLVAYDLVDPVDHGFDTSAKLLLEHSVLPYISYPYEWGFNLLKSAAVMQLQIILESLEHGVMLSDASAYNIQFVGAKPIFIDHLSFRPYQEGEYWIGHRQFCEQFLNPLLLRSSLGIPHNSWYRGSLEGITSVELNKLLPVYKKMGLNMFTQVHLQAHFQTKSIKQTNQPTAKSKAIGERKLPKKSLEQLILSMLRWINKLQPKDQQSSIWSNYVSTKSYTDAANSQKGDIVSDYVTRTKSGSILDLGCNTGEYSEIALNAGATRVVAYDFDHGALDRAFDRAEKNSLNLLPLFLDATNPPPDQGWMQSERQGFSQRANTDGLLALALIHHIVIGKNVPLESCVQWLLSLADHGLIEFVPKTDPMVQILLMNREDIFPQYTVEKFRSILSSKADVVSETKIIDSDRIIFEYSNILPSQANDRTSN